MHEAGGAARLGGHKEDVDKSLQFLTIDSNRKKKLGGQPTHRGKSYHKNYTRVMLQHSKASEQASECKEHGGYQ